jgi:ABC-2 type transport system permease protein
MQVFRTYFKILKKQMVAILIYAGLFLGLSILLSSSATEEKVEFEPSKVNVMIVNEDGQNSFIDGFLDHFKEYVTLIETEEDEDARRDALFFRKVVYILTIPEGFTEGFLTGEEVSLIKQSVPDSIDAMSVDTTIDNYFNMARVYIKHVPELSYDKLNAYIEENLKAQTQVAFSIARVDEIGYSNEYNKNYFNYLGYINIAAFITGVSIVMLSFHGIDIRRKHFASPLTGRSMNAQLLFANLLFILAYLVIFIVAGYFLNKHRVVNANTILTWINAFVFSLTALSISYLVGITVKSRKAIAAIATALSLSLAFISGIFVPQEYLGASVLRVASFTPTYWFVKANNAIETISSFQWTEASKVYGFMGIQLGFAAAIISIALVVSKRKRQQQF